MTEPLRVFLCHSSNDKPSVRALHRRLVADGFAPWLDEVDLLPGQDWDREIQKAIRSSDIVVVCLSEDSTTRRGYVQKEIGVVLDAAEELPEGAIFLIPARLEDCAVPDRLRRWQWVDLFADEGYQRLRHSLDAHLDATTTRRQNGPREVTSDDAGAPPGDTRSVAVRFDGLYAQPGADATSLIRFVTPDTALTVTVGSPEPPESLVPVVARWLLPGDPNRGEGTFELDGQSIRWDATSSSGTVRHHGTVSTSGTDLRLHTHSLINGYESYGVWRFVPLTAPVGPIAGSSERPSS